MATIFALERRSSEGIDTSIFFGSRTDLNVEVQIGNVPSGAQTTTLLQLEREVSVPLTASEFAQSVPNQITVDQSVDILRSLGINVPSTVNDGISTTLRDLSELTPQQIAEFIRRAESL